MEITFSPEAIEDLSYWKTSGNDKMLKRIRNTPAIEAKLISKPMIIEDIANIAYTDEIAATNKRLERMNWTNKGCKSQPFFITFTAIKIVIMNYWIFQGRKDLYDFNLPIIFEDWGVRRFINEIKEGDKGIAWLTGKEAGCYALIDIVSNPQRFGISIDNPRWKEDSKQGQQFKKNDKNEIKVKVKIYQDLFKNPLLRKDLKTGRDLKTIKGLEMLHVGAGYIGTNFSLQPAEYEIIVNLIQSR